MIRFPRWVSTVAICAIVSAAALAADYEERRFPGGAAWYLFDGPVETALYVPNPDAPKCHEIGEIILLLDRREQLLDGERLEQAAVTAMDRYQDLCRDLGQRGSSQRSVIGVVKTGPSPDDKGRFTVQDQLLSGYVTTLGRTDGGYNFLVRRNVVLREKRNSEGREKQIEERREAQEWLRNGSSKFETREDQASSAETQAIAMARAEYESQLGFSLEAAQSKGIVSRLLGGDGALLTGVWSGSQAECARDKIVLFERGDNGTVEWWRLASERVGMLPLRSGSWELRDGTLIMSFDEEVDRSFVSGEIERRSINETLQLDIADLGADEMRLSATGGFSAAMFLLGGEEKLFVRCSG